MLVTLMDKENNLIAKEYLDLEVNAKVKPHYGKYIVNITAFYRLPSVYINKLDAEQALRDFVLRYNEEEARYIENLDGYTSNLEGYPSNLEGYTEVSL